MLRAGQGNAHDEYNHRAFATGPNENTLKGYGLAAAVQYQVVELKGTVAWRNGAAAQSAPDRSPRFWLALRRGF